MNNTYPKQGWQVPVNNFQAWGIYHTAGMYVPANDNDEVPTGDLFYSGGQS